MNVLLRPRNCFAHIFCCIRKIAVHVHVGFRDCFYFGKEILLLRGNWKAVLCLICMPQA